MKIRLENLQKRIKIDKWEIRTKVTRLMKLVNCADKEISITFVDDPTIQRINKQYLSRDKTTNVISFSLQEGDFGDINRGLLGDIVISVDTAHRDAEKGNFEFTEELIFLIIHGLLHLTGYNHENTSKTDALKMKKKEKELFSVLVQSR